MLLAHPPTSLFPTASSVVAYNLCVLIQHHLGWVDRVNAAALRFRLFTTGGIISTTGTTGGRTTIRLAVPREQRPWWRSLYEKLLMSKSKSTIER